MTIRSATVEPDGTFTVHVAGAANVSKRALRQAVWSMLGGVAEMSAHVREIRDTNGVRFEMLTGMPPGEGPFPTHGHRLRLVIAETA